VQSWHIHPLGTGGRGRLDKEAHHFYPVLFYMRFAEHYYSVSFVTLVLLDAVNLMRSALSEQNAAIKELRALDKIWQDPCFYYLA
jgi:hypothetical protein